MADARANAGMAEVYPILLGSALAPGGADGFRRLKFGLRLFKVAHHFRPDQMGPLPHCIPQPKLASILRLSFRVEALDFIW